MFQRCLICTDLEDGLQRLANFVPSLVSNGIQQLVFLHMVPLPDEQKVPRLDEKLLDAARDRLSIAERQVPAGVEVKVEVKWGRPIEGILATSKDNQSDLILLGMSSRGLISEKLFGSTTMALCQRRVSSLLIFRPQLVSTYTAEELDLRCRHLFRYLLVPYDGTSASDYLIGQIKEYAQNRQPGILDQCLVCWVVNQVGRSQELEDVELTQANQKLTAIKAELAEVGMEVETQLRTGNPIVEVLALAQEYDISAIATSSNLLGTPLSWAAPSFAAELLRRSWHPVLYIPYVD